ncbi:hypothetical protein HIM_00783 [Hirsutella minnesotensis 3608]|nr:hypothetical protein HIM_00783 [Hirsutella minnesotensis 3608]
MGLVERVTLATLGDLPEAAAAGDAALLYLRASSTGYLRYPMSSSKYLSWRETSITRLIVRKVKLAEEGHELCAEYLMETWIPATFYPTKAVLSDLCSVPSRARACPSRLQVRGELRRYLPNCGNGILVDTLLCACHHHNLKESGYPQGIDSSTEPLGAHQKPETAQTLRMLLQRIARASAQRGGFAAARVLPTTQRRGFLPSQFSDPKILDEKFPDRPKLSETEDPGMNGGYINPPRIKRQHRDPHANWWDPQERRNFGEPVHEDNDMLGVFSPHEYTWTTTRPGLIMVGTFIAVFLGVSGIVYHYYPDKKSYPREFEGGLQRELGGPGAIRARMPGDEDP